MRLLIFIFLITLNLSAQKEPVVRTVTIKTHIDCDHCVACETCGEHFNKKLLREKGIQMVTLDEKAMTVKVVYNSKKISVDQIRTAISKLGYDADEVNATAESYANLDDCCKK